MFLSTSLTYIFIWNLLHVKYIHNNMTWQFRTEGISINFYMYMYLVSSIRTECILLECKYAKVPCIHVLAVLFCRRRSRIWYWYNQRSFAQYISIIHIWQLEAKRLSNNKTASQIKKKPGISYDMQSFSSSLLVDSIFL